MSQAISLYYMMKQEDMDDTHVPKAMQVLYDALLIEKYPVSRVEKKPNGHYVIRLEETEYGSFNFHITPREMWWECIY